MAETTTIAWTHSTFNPWIGCTKIGPGCDNCYASSNNTRFHKGENWGAGAPRREVTDGYWRKVLTWNDKAKASGEPWRVFCASQADVFDNEADPALRARLFELIKKTPSLSWLLLTKRIGNVKAMLPKDWGDGYPNVWLGITVVNQEEANRDVPKLQETPARIRWLSIEPQIDLISMQLPRAAGDGEWTYYDYPLEGKRSTKNGQYNAPRVDWIVCGGESRQQNRCRKFDLLWAKHLLDECKAAGVPFFMKQLGSEAYLGSRRWCYSGKGDYMEEWPDELRVREFPV